MTSSTANTKIDQKEYLKKYLYGDKTKKKKKSKDKSKKSATVKIIDDDAQAPAYGEDYEEILLAGEDAPQIAGEFIEEAPSESKQTKWRKLGEDVIKNENGDKHADQNDLWGRKPKKETYKDEFAAKTRKIKSEALSDDDLSPKRIRKKQRGCGDSNSDLSPRRHKVKSERRSDDDLSPKRIQKKQRGRGDSDSDLSPRRHKVKSDRRSDDDLSPNRIRKIERHRTIERGNSQDIDLSPPRKSRFDRVDKYPSKTSKENHHKRSSSSDQSPPRRSKPTTARNSKPRYYSEDASPVRRQRRSRSFEDCERRGSDMRKSDFRRRSPDSWRHERYRANSPKRHSERRSRSPARYKGRDYDPSSSYRRLNRSPASRSPVRRRSDSPPPTHAARASKTLDGKKAGLQDAAALKAENEERRRAEDRMYEKMSSSISGRDADVRVRASGRRGKRFHEADEDPETRKRKEEHERKKKEQYERWGKGLKQVEDHRERMEQNEYESSKPLARYANDEDLERHLKEQERADDPMLEYMRRKRKQNDLESNKPSRPIYEGTYPENRFGIRPGYRWDGVDRSNGYEKKWFNVQNERRALQEDAYKYSVEDM